MRTNRKSPLSTGAFVWGMVAWAFVPLLALGQGAVFDSGSTGADGAYSPATSEVFSVAKATYHFTTINIPAGVTVTFAPDLANNFPVVWLAQGDVTINGRIDASGSPGHNSGDPFPQRSVGGPGGWSGGTGAMAAASDPDISLMPTAGQGPGAGLEAGADYHTGNGAGYLSNGEAGYAESTERAGRSYGNSFGVPLLGGSGGGGGGFYNGNPTVPGGGAGAGGGAILIASSGDIAVSATGSIAANGGAGGGVAATSYGGGGGSGGLIRLVANQISVSGGLSAAGGVGGNQGQGSRQGGDGSNGRVRLDAFLFDLTGTSVPIASTGVPVLLDTPGDAPRLAISTINGSAITDPTGSPNNPDLILSTSSAVPVVVTGSNIPLGTQVTLTLYANNAPSSTATTPGLTGTVSASTASVDVTFQPGVTQIIATASFTPTARVLASNGERVKTIEVSSTLGGAREIVWITESGKRLAPTLIR